MKFRKKPIVIGAEQWFEGKEVEGVTYHEYWTDPADIGGRMFTRKPCVMTLEGRMYVSEGDWIITGVNGEKYPCKPDIFEKTYEPVKENL